MPIVPKSYPSSTRAAHTPHRVSWRIPSNTVYFLAAMTLVIGLSTSPTFAATNPNSSQATPPCGKAIMPADEMPFISGVAITEDNHLVLYGRGLKRVPVLMIDGAVYEPQKITFDEQGETANLPLPRYTGSRMLPATVSIQARSQSGDMESNECLFEYRDSGQIEFAPMGFGGTHRGEVVVSQLLLIHQQGLGRAKMPTIGARGEKLGWLRKFLLPFSFAIGVAEVSGRKGVGIAVGYSIEHEQSHTCSVRHCNS